MDAARKDDEENAPRLQCNWCDKSYATKRGLVKHVSVHIGENRTYICEMCGKSYTSYYSLGVHQRTHTTEKSNQCDTCGESFTTKNVLKVHCWRHTGDKPYKCQACGASFVAKSTWINHPATHAEPKPQPCPECLRISTRWRCTCGGSTRPKTRTVATSAASRSLPGASWRCTASGIRPSSRTSAKRATLRSSPRRLWSTTRRPRTSRTRARVDVRHQVQGGQAHAAAHGRAALSVRRVWQVV